MTLLRLTITLATDADKLSIVKSSSNQSKDRETTPMQRHPSSIHLERKGVPISIHLERKGIPKSSSRFVFCYILHDGSAISQKMICSSRSSMLQQEKLSMAAEQRATSSRRYNSFAGNRQRQSFWSLPIPVCLLSLVLLILLPRPAKCQQTASISIPLFTTNKTLSRRTNVCDRAQELDKGERDDDSMRYALEGLQLTVAAGVGIYFRYEDGILNEEYPGLTATLLDELATRGKFTWRDTFAASTGPGANHSWTELLLFQTENFDLVADWWMKTVARIKLGVAYPEGWYDASYILVASKGATGKMDNVNWFSWLLPFQPDVWMLILFTLFWSGLVYMFLEYLAYPGQYTGRRARESFGNDIFLSFLLFTQHFEFTPKTPASRILATSMALWALLISSAYTANLASFFVDQNQQNYDVTSLEEAVRRGKPICVWDTVPNAIYVQQKYPTGIYVKLQEEEDLYHGVTNGLCAVAVTTMTSYRDFSKRKEINPDCTLDWVGSIIKPSMAGFATKTDAGRKCTSLVNEVVNLHLLEMEVDGTLEHLWNEHYSKTLDHFCEATNSQDDEDSQRMSLEEMGGTFALHFTVSIFAMALGVATKVWKVYNIRKVRMSTLQPPPKKELPPIWAEMESKSIELDLAAKTDKSDCGSKNTDFTASFIEDFWAGTSDSRLMSYRSKDPSTRNVGMNTFQLMDLLEGEFEKQQDQLQEKLEDQLGALMDQKLEQQQSQVEQRMDLLQQQLAIMMDILKEKQVGGSATSGHEPLMPQNGESGPLTNSAMSITNDGDDDESQGIEKTIKAKQNDKSMPGSPHETRKLGGATSEYFVTSDDDMSIHGSAAGVRLRKVKSIDQSATSGTGLRKVMSMDESEPEIIVGPLKLS